jgi:cytochrome c oxidase assembly protein subunit 15
MTHRNTRLYRYATFVVVAIVVLIFFGGQVKSTGSGLSVPDWPNTYGHFMFSFPYEKMVGGIFWEHTHRMIASITGLLTFVLTFWVYRVEHRRWVKHLALFASIAVVVQGILGGLTVWHLLPAWISTSHGTLGQLYFCSVVALALFLSPKWNDNPTRVHDSPRSPLRTVALVTTITIFAQLVIGAIMRHSEAGLAIPDFPMMFGSWVPPLSDERLAMANRELWQMDLLWKMGNAEITRWQMIAHLLHRLGAVVVTGMVIWTAVKVFREHRENRQFRNSALLLVGLVIIQATLGILTILTEKQFTITTLHVVTGAITLATSLVLTIRVRHHLVDGTAPAPSPIRQSVIAEEVAV